MGPKQQQKENPNTNTTILSKADKLKEQGNKSFQNQNYQKAIRKYTEAIEIDATQYSYYGNRSSAFYQIFKFEQALLDASESVKLDPTFTRGYIYQAQALLELDLIQQAQLSLQQAQEMEPEDQQVKELWKQLIKEQAENNVLDSSDPEILQHETMVSWLNGGKSTFPQFKMRWYSQNYRGVHAQKKIYNQDIILFVPLSHLITLEMGRDTAIGKKITEGKLDLLSPKHTYLSTYLLQQKKQEENTFWKPYLDILPSDYNSFPIFFTVEELKWLQGSPFLIQVKQKISDVRQDYEDVCSVAPEFRNYTFDEFKWARMSASSRIFGIQIKGVKTDAFVPLADMLNHKRHKQTSWSYDDKREGFIIEAQEDIPRGDQVYDSYGKKCNSRFLLNYGFILLDNDSNEVAVKVNFDSDDPCLNQQNEMILSKNTDEAKTFRILENFQEQNVVQFFAYVRFVQIRDRTKLLQLNTLHERNSENKQEIGAYKANKTPVISVENEIEMWKYILQILTGSYSQYPQTLEEDRQLLQRTDISQNNRNCVLLREGEQMEIQKQVSTKEYKDYSNYINKIISSGVMK